ncbi:MAG TPA: hypothetical protein VN926_24430 [Bradyrhizobium sp.]|jgi:hypothetical protein|nr:hypothetical protein [Bradyrhizobium sp.]
MLLVDAAVHGATLLLVPRVIMLRTMAGMTNLAGAANTIARAPRHLALAQRRSPFP